MPTTFCVRTRDNRWISQKLSTEKSTIGNEPYINNNKNFLLKKEMVHINRGLFLFY